MAVNLNLPPNAIPVATGQVAEDGDVMAIITYTGSAATHTIDIDTNALVLEAPAGTQAASLDLTDAAYNTYGEVADYINDSVDDWKCTLVGALRSDNTYASDLKIVDPADASVGQVAGYQLKADSSTLDKRRICLGAEIWGVYEDTTAPTLSGSSAKTLPRPGQRDPKYGNTTSGLYFNTFTATRYKPVLEHLNVLATDSSTAITVTVTRCTQAADGTSYTLAAPTSGTRKIYALEDGTLPPISAEYGERLVISVNATGNISSSDVGLSGHLLAE